MRQNVEVQFFYLTFKLKKRAVGEPVEANLTPDVEKGEVLTIDGDGEQTRDFIHVSDIVKAVILALERRLGF